MKKFLKITLFLMLLTLFSTKNVYATTYKMSEFTQDDVDKTILKPGDIIKNDLDKVVYNYFTSANFSNFSEFKINPNEAYEIGNYYSILYYDGTRPGIFNENNEVLSG